MIPTLKTPRLCLRPFERSDETAFSAIVNSPRLTEHTPFILSPLNANQFSQWVKQQEKLFSQQKSLTLAIEIEQTKVLIGCINLHNINTYHRSAEIGYWLGVDHWGKGYMQEALTIIIEFGFNAFFLHRLEAFCLKDNFRSHAVLLRCGFKLEGEQKQKLRIQNQWKDLQLFGLIESDNQS